MVTTEVTDTAGLVSVPTVHHGRYRQSSAVNLQIVANNDNC